MTRRLFLGLFLVLCLASANAWAVGCTGTGNCYYLASGGGATVNNWSDTTKWYTADAGAGTNGGLPGTTDNVWFTAATYATAYTVTVDATANCADMTWALPGTSGVPTLAGASILNIYGSISLVSGMVNSLSYRLYKKGTGVKTITSNSVVWNADIYLSSAETTRLVDDFTTNKSIVNDSGTGASWDPTTNLKATILTGSSPNIGTGYTFYDLTRTGNAVKTDALNLQNDVTVTHNLTINGNSAINRVLCNSATIGTARTITTGGTITLSNCDFRDVTFGSTNSRTISGGASDGGTGTRLATAAAHGLVAGMNVLIAGTTNYNGTKVVGTVSDTTHFDIADAYVSSQAGTWTHDFSTVALGPGGIGGGVCSGLVGLTPTTAMNLFYHEAEAGANNWSTVGKWFDTTNGAGTVSTYPPLMQDTAKFNADSFDNQKTVTQDMPRIGSVDWTGAGFIPSWTTSTVASVYGSITLITATTGMVLTASTQAYIFEGRGSYALTSAGNTWAKSVTLNAPGGTLTFQDAFANGSNITHTSGTLTLNNINVTVTTYWQSGANTSSVILNMGTGTISLAGGGIGYEWYYQANNVVNASTSTIKLTNTSAGTTQFRGGGKTYNNLWISRGAGTGEVDFFQGDTFAQLKDDGSANHAVKFTKSTTTTVADWQIKGNAGQLITLDTVDGLGTFAINRSVAGTVCADYLNIQRSVAGGAGVVWKAGAHSTNNNGAGSGWIFSGCASARRLLLGVGQ